MGYIVWFIKNLVKQLPLTADEKKELNKIHLKEKDFQGDLEIVSLLGDEDRLKSTSGVIEDLSKSRRREMRKVWKRRWQVVMGK